MRVQGLPVTDATTTWCDLAGELTLDELVVLGDAILSSSSRRIRLPEPEPELNAEVGDARRRVARVDFLWAAQKVVVEYEGDHHRADRSQWQWDIHRTRALETLGFTVVRMTAADVRDPVLGAALLRRLRAVLSR